MTAANDWMVFIKPGWPSFSCSPGATHIWRVDIGIGQLLCVHCEAALPIGDNKALATYWRYIDYTYNALTAYEANPELRPIMGF